MTGQPHPISNGSTGEVDFDARADGSKVAYRTVRAGRDELWERSVSEGHERLLPSSTDRRLAKPLWSPDGGRLAFQRWDMRDSTVAVAVLNTDGSGERVLAAARPGRDAGFRLVEGRPGDSRAVSIQPGRPLLDLPGSRLEYGPTAANRRSGSSRRIPRRNLFNQRFSPDQRWITFLAHDLWHASTSTVYVAPTTGGPWQAITDGSWFDDKPRWGPDGRTVFFVSNRTGVANVWGRRFDPSTGTPVGEAYAVTSFRSAQFLLTPETVQMDIAITATHLLLPMSESRSDIWMLDQVDR